MSLAAHEVNIVTGQDHALAVETQVFVDERTGVAAKVENVTMAVNVGDGNVAVVKECRIVGMQAQLPDNENEPDSVGLD